MLRGEKLAARFTGISGVVGDEKFVGIAKQVDLVAFKVTKIQPGYTFEHGGQTQVFILYRIAKAVAGGVKIGKQAFDVWLRGVAVGRTFNGGKDGGQIGI